MKTYQNLNHSTINLRIKPKSQQPNKTNLHPKSYCQPKPLIPKLRVSTQIPLSPSAGIKCRNAGPRSLQHNPRIITCARDIDFLGCARLARARCYRCSRECAGCIMNFSLRREKIYTTRVYKIWLTRVCTRYFREAIGRVCAYMFARIIIDCRAICRAIFALMVSIRMLCAVYFDRCLRTLECVIGC